MQINKTNHTALNTAGRRGLVAGVKTAKKKSMIGQASRTVGKTPSAVVTSG